MRRRLLGLVLPLLVAPLAVISPAAPATSLAPAASQVTVTTDKSSYTIGDTVHITATLVTGGNNAELSIFRTVDGTTSLLVTGLVDASQQLRVDVAVTKATTTSFRVEYAGNQQFDPSSATTSVQVYKKATSVRVTTDRGTYRYGATARVSVTLASASTNRAVRLYKVVNGNRTLLKSGSVPAGGALSTQLSLVRRTGFLVTYAGDAQYAAASASKTVTVAAKVTPRMFNNRSRSGKFYRAGDVVLLRGTVAPNHAGDCLYIRVQFLVNGSYGYDDGTGCVPMSSRSLATGRLTTSKYFRGHAIRLRAEWRGDAENRARNSAWSYAKFT